ncbi:TFIIH basal transcription factor complex subunit SSL1 [Epithele typhae]|uniref:TFIIH basal transcription factor complex subunit SSL1 n=1 Tax=Epithele typhae TaxID=378194 RepID=UPI0020088537|nr:TFIIH basal transcription factor complex subunit SSL1 [Epithele typhae]KAH9940414.1 TFIIH basal transcription factor complex subunit SSL1 [Epithele typhae]
MPPPAGRRIGDDFVDDSESDVSIGGLEDDHSKPKGKGKGKATDKRKIDKGKSKAKDQAYAWEATYTRSWDTVQEDEAGRLEGAVQDLIARGRRRRLLAPAAAIRRTIIRHLVLVLDLSSAMTDRDMRPTRFDLMLQYAREFVTEWFDQNPLGQIGIVGMRGGLGERVGEMSGTPQDVLKSVSERHKLEPAGEPSLQNAVEMARSSMGHLPTHSSREIVVVYGSLTTCDPGNIHDTIDECVKDKIRISVVALAAEMKVCRTMCEKTGGQFGVAMNEGHFKDLLFELIPPPAQKAGARPGAGPAADLMIMGFPMRLPESSPPALCVCHSELKSEGFLCPRCLAKVCDVPTDCDICGLMIVSSPHLARSYHHLFPVKPYAAVTTLADTAHPSKRCHGCASVLREAPAASAGALGEGMSPYGRYRCPDCAHDFCSDCDVFVHDVVHCCPGCGK